MRLQAPFDDEPEGKCNRHLVLGERPRCLNPYHVRNRNVTNPQRPSLTTSWRRNKNKSATETKYHLRLRNKKHAHTRAATKEKTGDTKETTTRGGKLLFFGRHLALATQLHLPCRGISSRGRRCPVGSPSNGHRLRPKPPQPAQSRPKPHLGAPIPKTQLMDARSYTGTWGKKGL